MLDYSRSPFVMLCLSYKLEADRRRAEEEAAQAKTKAQTDSYICLNNLYLNIEAGRKRLTVRSANDLRILASMAYNPGDPMLDYWAGEFEKLPGWNNV